jgi:hypothetical protein
MGWLEDSERILRYRCPAGHDSHYAVKASEFNTDPRPCLHCEQIQENIILAEYQGMEPFESNVMTKVMYDKNGRLAYRFSDGKGNVSHMSKTKYDYKETGKIQNQYTPEFKKALVDAGRLDMMVSDTSTTKRKPNVTLFNPTDKESK